MSALLRPGWLLHLTPALLSVVVVFYLGTGPGDTGVTPNFEYGDKVGHFFAFAFVQMTHARAHAFLRAEDGRKRIHLWAFVMAGFWGGLLELWQATLPHRTAEVADFLADIAGAGGAALIGYALLPVLAAPESKDC